LLLNSEIHTQSCHFVVVSMLYLCAVVKVAEKVNNTVFSTPRVEFSSVLFDGCKVRMPNFIGRNSSWVMCVFVYESFDVCVKDFDWA